jgi:hypothetical protein
MFGPQSIEEAKGHRYGEWAGCPNGHAFDPKRCFAVVWRGMLSGQCSKPAGKDGLCGIHRRMQDKPKEP